MHITEYYAAVQFYALTNVQNRMEPYIRGSTAMGPWNPLRLIRQPRCSDRHREVAGGKFASVSTRSQGNGTIENFRSPSEIKGRLKCGVSRVRLQPRGAAGEADTNKLPFAFARS
jgi:hypothetical protein